jgi:hypothetical protein
VLPVGDIKPTATQLWFGEIHGWRGGTAMIGDFLSNGRLLSLQGVEWMMLLGGSLAGAVILML